MEDGERVGCLALVKDAKGIFISEIQILPQYQGRGIGKLIVKSLISEAEKSNLPITLEVLKVNGRARDFFARLGFRNSEETDSHHKMSRYPD